VPVKQRVYVETSIISYLTARLSQNLILAARQAATEQWWREFAPRCDLFVSELVVREAGLGDDDARQRRLAVLEGIARLPMTVEARGLVRRLLTSHALPSQAEDDAAHVALAAAHGMDVLLTWNCRHIANVVAAPRIRDIIEKAGYRAPTITTPQDLLESLGEFP
jgi:predicted nucleic acid-binding protein